MATAKVDRPKIPGKALDMAEVTTLLTLIKEGRTDLEIGVAMGRSKETIRRYRNKYASSVEVARAVINAGAVKLAQRVVAKANVKEAIDVLSRPNIGVLDPPAGKQDGGGIQISVGLASCGTVIKVESGSTQAQIGVMEGTPNVPELPPANVSVRSENAIDGEIVQSQPPGRQVSGGA